MDKAFNTVFELDKHAKACDAGNRSIKFLSYIGQHILRHLEFIRFPFCLNGKAFPCRGMACHEGKLIVQVFLFLLGKFLPRPLLLEETMDQQIWIAPDGRGKMRVVLGSKAKVAHIFRLVHSLLHAPQGEGGNHAFFGFSLHLAQGHLKNFRPHLALNLENGPKLGHDL